MRLWSKFIRWMNGLSHNESDQEVRASSVGFPPRAAHAELKTAQACDTGASPVDRVPANAEPTIMHRGRPVVRRLRTERYLPNAGQKPTIIGFDFGTHSTKILTRERGGTQSKIFGLDAPTTHDPTSRDPCSHPPL